MNIREKITWTNEKRKLSELIPWPRNPRQIKGDQAKRLVESFDEFGQVETIAIGPGNEVYNGHQRLNVLASKYGKDYPVEVRVSSRPLEEKEREKLTIFLHKGAAGEWDFDTLANEFELDDLLEWGFDRKELDLDLWAGDAPDDPGAQIDKAEELREKWGVELGQLWQLGEHRLICGDCTDRAVVERVMGGEKADSMFTDPPFNVDYDYGDEYEDNIKDYSGFTYSWLGMVSEIIDNGWLFVMNITKNIALTMNALSGFSEFANLIVWPHGTGAVPSNRFALGWQGIVVYQKGKTIFNYKAQTKKSVVSDERGGGINEDGRITDIWDDIKPVTAGSRVSKEALLSGNGKGKIHHAQMPEALPGRGILFCTGLGAIIYEPFSGSGTTLIACERLGRKCRAVEISPAYCAVAIQRWFDMTGGEPILVTEINTNGEP